MKNTKLRYQLYIFQVIISLFMFLFLGLTYFIYQHQYKKNIETQIENEIALHKKEILSSVNSATLKLNKQKDYFKSIHEETLKLLKQNPDLDLDTLKSSIKSKYLSSNVEVELFLIDSTYTIYKTTYLKDLGFNLSIVAEAKNYLDKTSRDGKIYVSDFLSTDALDMDYKLYSYSKLKDGIYFEMGFIDNTLTNTMKSLLKENVKSLSIPTLYNVSKDKEQYYYYPMNIKTAIKSKEEYYKTFIKVPLHTETQDKVINTVKQNAVIHIENRNTHTVYMKIFEKDMFDILGFENIVLSLEIDISSQLEFLQYYKNVFIASLIITLLLLVFLFSLIKNKFTQPIEKILHSLHNSQKVDDLSVISLDNELSHISIKYNYLYDKLNSEIELNKSLILIDPLTESYNRKAYDNTIDELLLLFNRYATPFSLIILDVDDFKSINDKKGHVAGDKILQSLVKLLHAKIRVTDTLFRVGGDEFIILCKNTLLADALNVAQKIRVDIENSLQITLSIGVTQTKEQDTNDSLYIRADENLYRSKQEGKNRVSSNQEENA